MTKEPNVLGSDPAHRFGQGSKLGMALMAVADYQESGKMSVSAQDRGIGALVVRLMDGRELPTRLPKRKVGKGGYGWRWRFENGADVDTLSAVAWTFIRYPDLWPHACNGVEK